MVEPDQSLRLANLESQMKTLANSSLKHNGGDGTSGGMEPRVAKLESDVGNIKEAIRDIKTDIRDLRAKIDSQFLIVSGMIIATALGLAGLMAKGFHWIGS
jgi:hypothetical protein